LCELVSFLFPIICAVQIESGDFAVSELFGKAPFNNCDIKHILTWEFDPVRFAQALSTDGLNKFG
jgi:hypothetical protein